MSLSACRGLLVASIFLISASARADQCSYLTRDQADRAINGIVASSRVALDFCEPCGDSAPGKPYRITEVRIREAGYQNYWEILVNKVPVDLAYLYIKTGRFSWSNVATLLGCETQGVSTTLVAPRLRTAVGKLVGER